MQARPQGIAIQGGGSLDNQTFASPTFTGIATFADGTAGAPSVVFTGDTNYGWYQPSAGIWTFTANSNPQFLLSNQLYRFASDALLGWSSTTNAVSGAHDVSINRSGVGQLQFGPGASTTANSRVEGQKPVTAFTNNVAKTVLTVTIPNTQNYAVLEIEVQGALGAGGAIGAGEAMATNTYKIAIVRTAGVATVATATSAIAAVAVAVAGAATVTATAAVTAMSGLVSATQTFDVQVTIARSGGSSDNHTALVYYKLVNVNNGGITVA